MLGGETAGDACNKLFELLKKEDAIPVKRGRGIDAEKTATQEGEFLCRTEKSMCALKLLNDKGSLTLTFKALLAHTETCGLLSFGKLQNP